MSSPLKKYILKFVIPEDVDLYDYLFKKNMLQTISMVYDEKKGLELIKEYGYLVIETHCGW
jgi:hypothetical protein